jgi:RNA polymerase sigma-70 factor (ECF subfamily)
LIDASERTAPDPGRFRAYLHVLAESQLGRGARAGVDPSDVVQQTLLDAHRGIGQFRGATEAEMAAWLRRLLSCNLADVFRSRSRARRDASRQVSLERALDESAARLGTFLVADQSSPSERVERAESDFRLAEALARLPDANRRALTMRYLEGRPIAEIAGELGRTPGAVAGLIKRGLAILREHRPDPGKLGPGATGRPGEEGDR